MHRTYHVSRMPTLNRKIRVSPTGPPRCSSAARSSRSASCSSPVPSSRKQPASGRCRRCPDAPTGSRCRPAYSGRCPRSPIGRGRPLKRVQVSVRTRPGAPAASAGEPPLLRRNSRRLVAGPWAPWILDGSRPSASALRSAWCLALALERLAELVLDVVVRFFLRRPGSPTSPARHADAGRGQPPRCGCGIDRYAESPWLIAS